MKHASLLALLLAVLCSCSSYRYAEGFEPENVDGIALFAPDSYVTYLASDGIETKNDSLSALASGILVRAALEIGLPVRSVIELDIEGENARKAFMQEVIARQSALRFQTTVPDVFDNLLEKEGCRYGLLLVSDGMKRDMHNYRKMLAAGIAMTVVTAILSFGTMVYENYPMKYSSVVCAALIDSQEDKLVFFNKEDWEADPVKLKHVKRQVARMMARFPKVGQ